MPDAPFLIEHGVAIPQNQALRDQFVALQKAINAIRALTGQPPISTDGNIGDATVKALTAVATDYGKGTATTGPLTPAFVAGLAPDLLKELHELIERLGAGDIAPAPHPHAATPPAPRASSSPIVRASSTQSAAKTMLEKETNARFWAQTGYKVGQKLDPNNATDRAMSKIWLGIFAKVQREDAAGKLVLTYNHPAVEQHLEDGSVATAATVHHLDAAANAQSDADRAANIRAASTAANMSKDKARAAAAYQPHSTSDDVTKEALDDIGQHVSSPDGARQIAASGYDQIAVAQAATSPSAGAHAGKSVQSTVSSSTIAGIRDRAADLARKNGPYVGVFVPPDGSITVVKFKSREEMYHWYETNSANGDRFKYIAMFDSAEPNGPAADMFGGSMALTVSAPRPLPRVDVTMPPVEPPAAAPAAKKKSSGWLVAGIVAAIGVAGGIAVVASKRNAASKPAAGRGRVAR